MLSPIGTPTSRGGTLTRGTTQLADYSAGCVVQSLGGLDGAHVALSAARTCLIRQVNGYTDARFGRCESHAYRQPRREPRTSDRLRRRRAMQ